jgi:hypothetical protein
MFHVPNKYRIKDHPYLSSTDEAGNNGAFRIKLDSKVYAFVIASDGLGWEHVSVHIVDHEQEATPLWEEMCRIKDMFWDPEDCVMQLHPPRSEYVNNHKNCLHLWRPVGIEIPRPDSLLVGIKNKQKLL